MHISAATAGYELPLQETVVTVIQWPLHLQQKQMSHSRYE
jgi:hypothetical protein